MSDFLALVLAWTRRHEVGLTLAILMVLVAATYLDSNRSYLRDPHASAVQIGRKAAFLGIFAVGAAIVIIAGGIDLSSGTLISFSASMCATFTLMLDVTPFKDASAVTAAWVTPTAILLTLLVGVMVGSLHAWLITGVGLPPFVATLATLVGLRSLGRAIVEFTTHSYLGSKTSVITLRDQNLLALARYGTDPGDSYNWLLNQVPASMQGLVGPLRGWPVIPVALCLLAVAATGLLMGRTVIGRHLYALGGNEQAARLSGVRTDLMKWVAYTLAAVLSTIAGILYLSDQGQANPETMGRAYELNAIAAAVVGGCSLRGGVGTMTGTALGALFLSVVIDGVARIIKTNSTLFEGVIVGIVVVLTVAFNQSSGRRRLFVGWLGLSAIANLALLTGLLAMLLGQSRSTAPFQVGCYVAAVVAIVLLIARQVEAYRGNGRGA